MTDQNFLYVHHGSLSHQGILYTPGMRVDVSGIPAVNIKAMRKSGLLISLAEKKALERAAQIAKQSRDGSWVVGTGKNDYMPEPRMSHTPSGHVQAEVENIRKERGDEPVREIEEPVFEDADDPEDEMLEDADDDPDMFPEDELLGDED